MLRKSIRCDEDSIRAWDKEEPPNENSDGRTGETTCAWKRFS